MSQAKPIQLGLCCINTQLRAQKPPVFCSRKMIIRSIEEQGIETLKTKIRQNLEDVLTMLEWNELNGIRVMRLSSELFPHKSNPKVCNYTFDFAIDLLQKIGVRARELGHRLTFHPGQYNVVGTPVKESFEQTICDLKYHADVLDLMGMGHDSVMVVHGGGIYGDKQATLQRWCEQYAQLPENVRARLVLENCEKCFSIEDCLWVSSRVGVPVVFDTHHFSCYKLLHPDENFSEPVDYIPRILATWATRGIKPKFHVSQQGSGRVGHHSDYISEIPEYLLNIPTRYGIEVDIMIEAKMKEQAILRLYEKHPQLNCKKGTATAATPSAQWSSKYADTCGCCGVTHKKQIRKKLVIVDKF
jgi:UV DNA damage endonuclease